jgi:pimeloyl-ACP methyl ester carboxylesterase
VTRDTVVLVHGLWMHGVAMLLMKRRIARCGYRVVTYSYPTVRLDMEENAQRLSRYCERLDPGGRIHFVGHSLGSCVAVKAAQRLPASRLGRLVLLGPPFTGSYSARRVQRLPGGRSIVGRCIDQWLAAARPMFASVEIGVIAGNRRFGLGCIFAPGLPLPNDGVVSVAETRIPGMRDHIVLGVSHTAMLVSSNVVRQVCAFLRDGKFDRA